MYQIFSSAGGVTIATKDNKKSSFIKIKGLETKTTSGCGLIMVTEVVFKKNDLIVPIVASDDIRIAYLFGKAFSKVEIKGVLLLGQNNKNLGSPLKTLETYFEKNRASKTKSTIQVSFAGAANIKFNVILHEMSVDKWEPDFNMINFTLTGLVLPTAKGVK